MKKKYLVIIIIGVFVLLAAGFIFFSNILQSSIGLEGRNILYLDDSSKSSFTINFQNSLDYTARDYNVLRGTSIVSSAILSFKSKDSTTRSWTVPVSKVWNYNTGCMVGVAKTKSACCGLAGYKANYLDHNNAEWCFNDVPVVARVDSVVVNGASLSVHVVDGGFASDDFSDIINTYCADLVSKECKLSVNVLGTGAVDASLISILSDNAAFTAPIIDLPTPTIDDVVVINDVTPSTTIPLIFWIILCVIIIIFFSIIIYRRSI